MISWAVFWKIKKRMVTGMLRIAKWMFLLMLIGHLMAKLVLPSWPWTNCLVGVVVSGGVGTYLLGMATAQFPSRRKPLVKEVTMPMRQMQVGDGPLYLLTEDIPLSEDVMGHLTGEERVSNIPRPGINIMVVRHADGFWTAFTMPGKSRLSRPTPLPQLQLTLIR